MSDKLERLQELKNQYEKCTKCSVCMHDVKVWGSGNVNALIAIVGEGPGSQERLHKKPFVGKSGQKLTELLHSVNINRTTHTYVTNAVLCRTDTRNRTPTVAEIDNCHERLIQELDIVAPRFVILTGTVALCTIEGHGHKITEERGQWYWAMEDQTRFYFPIFHPSYLLHKTFTPNEGALRYEQVIGDLRKFVEEAKSLHEMFTQKSGDPT